MAAVLGLGGLFIKSEDPVAMGAWYTRVLGIDWGDFGAMFPHPDRGFTLISGFRQTSTYFDPSPLPVMLNLIVDDLDGMLNRARAEGVEPLGRDDSDPNGRFGWLIDPWGLKIELWEPPASTD
ncbi:MAG: VOC family protein [Niveispirillum sp.]|uniref:VOC family protein n=1 Tax=Niveispirillum sp. TaxID=1917217 RepID=UPI003BA755DB